ncbi:MAG: TfuA-like protein, partial [Kofleriaceae bacterium]
MKHDTIVFVGPTLSAAEVRARLPGAIVRPPAAVGEILDLALARARPARIALIDGYFERMAAVWHKELLLAVERGITVFGAASMGALRAAELARFGMIGVGAIYRAFARGQLDADDEVAVAHLPAAQGYRATSEALVNIRFALARAPLAGARYIALARARFYRERSWAQLVTDARAAGLATAKLEAWLRTPPPDQKASDARALLACLARDVRRSRAKVRVPRTWALRQLIAIR